MQSESCHLLPTNTSNLYSQIRYDLPRKEFKHIDQNSIPQAPFPCGFLLYASPDQGHTSLRKHACSRAKVGTAPMHRNAGSCWTSAHFGETSKTRETCVNTWGSHEFHNISRWNPKPLAHMMVVQHVLLGQKAMDTVDAKACHGAPGPGSGHRCRLRKRRRPTKPSWALQGLHGVLLLGRKCGQHISILYHTVPPQLSQSQD